MSFIRAHKESLKHTFGYKKILSKRGLIEKFVSGFTKKKKKSNRILVEKFSIS